MTPAILFLKKQRISHLVHPYELSGLPDNYGMAVAQCLRVNPHQLFKTLMVMLNGDPRQLAVCIVPVSGNLNLKAAARCLSAKKAEMAPVDVAEKTTGYVVGGISPFGQKRRVTTVLDQSALNFETIFTSAGKRGLQIEFDPRQLISVLSAAAAPIADGIVSANSQNAG